MVSTASTHPIPGRAHVDTPPVMASTRFQIAVLVLSGWLLGGAYLDAWAHRHVARLETFFTPWHAVLYSGVLAMGTFLFINLMRGREAGRSWRTALPAGYGLSFVGFVLFGIGGVLDLTWHTIFGIERSYAASISPTHLLLMGSGALMLTGGLRAAWKSGRRELGYIGLLSATGLLAMLIFFSQDLHPFINQWSAAPTPFFGYQSQFEELGVAEVILESAALMGIVLFLIRWFALPFGALTIMLTLTTGALVIIWQPDPVFFVGVVGGIIGDALLLALRPNADRPAALRIFAVTLPVAIYLTYFLGILGADGIWWPIHVWVGAIVSAGVAGLPLSYLVVPPARVARVGA